MNPTSILNNLDKHAAEFNFPVLDNAYVGFTAARLSAFRSEQDWLIVFEVLGYSVNETAFVNDIYAYGSCTQKEGFLNAVMVAEPIADRPIFDSVTTESVADWSNWGIRVGNQNLYFTPPAKEYEKAGIEVNSTSGPGSIQPVQLLRFLFYKLGEQLFANEKTLFQHFPYCKDLEKFLRTWEWQHPDIAAGEAPSKNPSLTSLICALAAGDRTLFNSGQPNTTWRTWE